MPDCVGGGSVRVTTPGVNRSEWYSPPVIGASLCRYQKRSNDGVPARILFHVRLRFVAAVPTNGKYQSKPVAYSTGRWDALAKFTDTAISRAFCVRTCGGSSGAMRSSALVRIARADVVTTPASTTASTSDCTRIEEALTPSPPAAAIIWGEGVSPAASAAASGSPPGSAAATASAEDGRERGSGSRQRWITAPMAGSSSCT